MPMILRGKLDGSETVRYFHISLAGCYLRIAQDSALQALKDEDQDGALRHSVIAITFSIMALEALVNELCEDVIPEAERSDFIRLKRNFHSNDGTSSVARKLSILVERKHHTAIPNRLLAELGLAAELRNSLVHYKLSETAGQVFLPQTKPEIYPDGHARIVFDLTVDPVRINPPLLSKITSSAAARSYNGALDLFCFWCTLEGNPKGVEGFVRLPIGDASGAT